jgi:alkanesulfonate monooxygenase SsuD/methylene tetrahydromethanopterin reductase-like flavin-dependent oxidoreductase (luciferase family)
MRIGTGLPSVVPGAPADSVPRWARRAEELGFASVAVIDRVVYDSCEPLVALALAAAVTETVELVTDVLISPLRGTALLAKQAASIDRAAGGRLTLGLGVGAREDDFAACATPTAGRGRRFDAQLAELADIWAGRRGIGPAATRRAGRTGPGLLIGGHARHAATRAARYGDGWTMMVGTPEQFASGVAATRAAWAEAGRADEPRTMAVCYTALGPGAGELVRQAVGGYYAWLGPEVAGWIASTAATDEESLHERIAGFAAAGATDLVLVPCSADPDQLERFADAALRVPVPA